MIRFSKNEHKKFFISLSDFIRKIFKGDRTKRLSKKVELLIKKEAEKKKNQCFRDRFWLWINGNFKKNST
tara:strand:- start:668 stop:877 length:210 start_codon:yes stop_codon:yes gene_type:complete